MATYGSSPLPIAANYFVLEGPNGAGKTTLQPILCQMLAEQTGIVRALHDPNPNLLLGALIYRIRKERLPLGVASRELLWAAAAIEAQESTLPAASRQNALVIADRSPFTSYVELWSLTPDRFFALHEPYLFPRLTFHLRIDSALCAERLRRRDDPEDYVDWLEKSFARRAERYAEIYEAARSRGAEIAEIEVRPASQPEDLAREIAAHILRVRETKTSAPLPAHCCPVKRIR